MRNPVADTTSPPDRKPNMATCMFLTTRTHGHRPLPHRLLLPHEHNGKHNKQRQRATAASNGEDDDGKRGRRYPAFCSHLKKKTGGANKKKAMGGKVWADLAGRLFGAGRPRVMREATGESRGRERRKSG